MIQGLRGIKGMVIIDVQIEIHTHIHDLFSRAHSKTVFVFFWPLKEK